MNKYIYIFLLLFPVNLFAETMTFTVGNSLITYNKTTLYRTDTLAYSFTVAPYEWQRYDLGGGTIFYRHCCVEFNITRLISKKIKIRSAYLTLNITSVDVSPTTNITAMNVKPSLTSGDATATFNNCVSGTNVYSGASPTAGAGKIITLNTSALNNILLNKFNNKTSWLGLGFSVSDDSERGVYIDSADKLTLTIVYDAVAIVSRDE